MGRGNFEGEGRPIANLRSIANTVYVRQRCSLLSDYFDHLFYFYIFTSAGTSVYHETRALRHTALNQSYHFSGNLEMSGNFAQVRDKSLQGKVREFV